MNIPGYTHGIPEIARSPVTLADFDRMKQSALFADDDILWLRRSHDIVADQIEAILDVWYGFVGASPHLLASFSDPKTGAPLGDYLAAVRRRFGRWILDTSRAQYDQAWLDYQHEIGRRHHRAAKNHTDAATSTAIVPFRDLFALAFTMTFTLRPFLASRGATSEDVDKMYAAWLKSCLLQVTLWCHPYVKDGDF
ncbi:MAG: protogloblin ApPgb [Deltaproteobacteria bacterium]|nr:protogloblin ApPgb [Nannocystaceae bacterium]